MLIYYLAIKKYHLSKLHGNTPNHIGTYWQDNLYSLYLHHTLCMFYSLLTSIISLETHSNPLCKQKINEFFSIYIFWRVKSFRLGFSCKEQNLIKDKSQEVDTSGWKGTLSCFSILYNFYSQSCLMVEDVLQDSSPHGSIPAIRKEEGTK